MTEPYGTFTDKDFHAYLKKLGIAREEGTEWFFIEPNAARGDFIDFTQNHGVVSEEDADAVIPYKLRDEQAEAVQKTMEYFTCILYTSKPHCGNTCRSGITRSSARKRSRRPRQAAGSFRRRNWRTAF